MPPVNKISPVKIVPRDAPLGAEVQNVDLAKPVDSATFGKIEAAFHEYGVLIFRGQHLTEAKHVEFSKRFGELEIHVLKQYLDNGFPEIHVVSNVKVGDKPVGIADAGRVWHADYSYKDVPARASLLYAREVPHD